MPLEYRKSLETYVRRLMKKIQPFGVTDIQYGICDDIENIARFGLSERRGKNISFLPEAVHKELVKKGLCWERALTLEYCWMNQNHFEWSDNVIWDGWASPIQVLIKEVYRKHGFHVGVSFPQRVPISHDHCTGSAVLFFSRHRPLKEFQNILAENIDFLSQQAALFDQDVRQYAMLEIFSLTKGQQSALKLYKRLGDVAKIAKIKGTTARTVQLSLQRAREKLQVDSNIEALNLCQAFRLLEE